MCTTLPQLEYDFLQWEIRFSLKLFLPEMQRRV